MELSIEVLIDLFREKTLLLLPALLTTLVVIVIAASPVAAP